MEALFFSDLQSIGRTIVVGFLAYVLLVIFLRISGNRTLSKMNAFDLVVTVALGSTLATVLLSKSTSLATGAAAFLLLIGLQFAVTWSSVRVPWIRKVVTGEPRMLLYQGEFLYTAIRRARINQDDVRAAVRSAGITSMSDVDAVVLETDGSLSVMRRSRLPNRSSLEGVKTSEF